MRQHGFVFVELYVENPAEYVRIFRDALGFFVARDEGDFVELQSARGIVLLNRFDDPDPGHPFEHYREARPRGVGVEIGIVHDDVHAAWRAAKDLPGCTVSDVVEQEWGLTDFRILTPHGYYLRVTSP
jgi:catechol 2,3-dioxygenase-like lactoylglutathione lyase family enzyme